MSDQQPPDQPFQSTTVAARGVFGTKIPSVVVFGLGVLLFLMPFLDIRCNNMSIQKISGVQLATGFKVEAPGSNNSLFGNLPNNSFNNNSHEGSVARNDIHSKKDGNLYATAAIILGVLALVFAIINVSSAPVGGIITGVLAAIALIGLMADVKGKIGMQLKAEDNMVIAVVFTPFFYIAILAFLTGAYFCYKRLVSVKR